jgi:hypothetical protein
MIVIASLSRTANVRWKLFPVIEIPRVVNLSESHYLTQMKTNVTSL